MVLSRIWSAFIIIAVLVGAAKYMFSPNYKSIFNDMVVGKGGDTVKIAGQKISEVSPTVFKGLNDPKSTDFADGRIHFKTDSLKQNVQVYRIQETDGVIGTSKTAVEICIGLIGIMTLFMGFMSIAEKAGGINLLSRFIQPFFSKLFPDIPKNHPAFGHMLLNFFRQFIRIGQCGNTFRTESHGKPANPES